MAVAQPFAVGASDRGYAVTLVARTTNDHHLHPPLDLPEGITATIDGPEILLTVPIVASDAKAALAVARTTVTDLLMTLASTFNGYELVVDERQLTRRTHAVYQTDGPPPPFDVAEGAISDAGAELLDPDGEMRRAGRVLAFRATGVVVHPPTDDVRRFAGRAAWPPRLRSGLRLFHAAQNARDEIVEFTLTAAALEVLADADKTPLLNELGDTERHRLRSELDVLLDGFELLPDKRDRLRKRLLDTQATGSNHAVRDYLQAHGIALE
jgi:hypothetical protein